MVNFSPGATLAQMRTWLQSRAHDGVNCPLCTQRVQIYRRKVNSGMARSLIKMYRVGGGAALEWVHVPTQIGARSREEGKLAYWDLVEEQKEVLRDDGGRAGYWRVTPLGEAFIRGGMTIPKYAHVFNGRVISLDHSEQVSIKDALGTDFDLSELMAGL